MRMKPFYKLVFIMVLLSLFETGFAQKKNQIDSLIKLIGPELKTIKIGDDSYEGKDLRIGTLSWSFQLKNIKPVPKDFEIPEDLICFYSFCNRYHIDDINKDCSEELKATLEECKVQDTCYFNESYIEQQYRGGLYRYQCKIPSFGINIDKDTILLADPRYTEEGLTMCSIGKDSLLYTTFTFDTGYPFDPDTLKQEMLNLKFYKIKSDKTLELIEEKNEPFTLLDKEKPLISGFYSYTYKPNIKELGEYLLEMKSSWNNIERKFRFSINDTVRAEVKLDKEIYHLGADKKAVLNVKMDYDYPFVMPVNNDAKPTIRFVYDISSKNKSLCEDSLLLANDAFSNQHVNIEENIELPFATILSKYDLADEQDTLNIDFGIIFNDRTQYRKRLPLFIKRTTTGIELLEADGKDKKVEYFNLAGQRIPAPTKGKVAYIERRNGKVTKKF